MGIFSKLISPSKKAAPGTEQRVRSLLADLDVSSPLRTLKDIEERLTELAAIERSHGAATAQSAFVQLDQSGVGARAALLQKSLSALDPLSSGQVEWSALSSHAAELIAAHATFSAALIPLAQSEAERNRVARDAVSMLRTWALCKKLQHFRYQTPPAALWQQAHALLRLLMEHKLEQILVVPYPGESAVTPLREYLIGAYFECLPEGKLLPQQQEALDRFLRTCDRLAFTLVPETNSTHRIDLMATSGPKARKDGDASGSSIRFLSTVLPHEQLIKIADALANDRDIPKWLSSIALDVSVKETTFRTLAHHWSSRPPRRMAERHNASRELRVVIGFSGAYRMISASQELRALETEADITQPARLTADSPLTLLQQIEATGKMPSTLSLEIDAAEISIETWQRVDLSATGMSATLPALLPRHCVGALIAIRPVDDVNWQLGLIRRVGRDATKHPVIGIEIIDDEASCAHANLIDHEQVWSEGVEAAGWSNVIFLKKTGHDVLLPPGSFANGKLVRVTQDKRSWQIRLETLLDRGPDYDRARFSSVA